jgi:non-heme chloroperoxidase
MVNSDYPEFFKTFTSLCAGSNQFVSANIAQRFSNMNERSSSYALEQSFLLLRDADLYWDLKKINIYTVIFHGKKDRIFPFTLAERLHDALPRSYFVPFENSGHTLVLEEMEKFNSTLLKFIRFANIKQGEPAQQYY